jgi:hypothetical protein
MVLFIEMLLASTNWFNYQRAAFIEMLLASKNWFNYQRAAIPDYTKL